MSSPPPCRGSIQTSSTTSNQALLTKEKKNDTKNRSINDNHVVYEGRSEGTATKPTQKQNTYNRSTNIITCTVGGSVFECLSLWDSRYNVQF